MSDSVQPHRQQPARLPRPWGSPGKSRKLFSQKATDAHCLARHKRACLSLCQATISSVLAPPAHWTQEASLCGFHSGDSEHLFVSLTSEELGQGLAGTVCLFPGVEGLRRQKARVLWSFPCMKFSGTAAPVYLLPGLRCPVIVVINAPETVGSAKSARLSIQPSREKSARIWCRGLSPLSPDPPFHCSRAQHACAAQPVPAQRVYQENSVCVSIRQSRQILRGPGTPEEFSNRTFRAGAPRLPSHLEVG